MSVPPVDAQTVIRALVQAALQSGEIFEWTDWMPLSLAAVRAPDRWVDIFTHLRLEQQLDLLNFLADSAAGPMADALLLLLASHAYDFIDDQVRQNTLDYAATAYKRRFLQIGWLKDRLQVLMAGLEHARSRIGDGFSMAMEMTRLEKELAEIRSRDNLEDRFSQIHAMESEIFRLEILLRSLSRYEKDRSRREAHLEDLKHKAQQLGMQKKQIENAVAIALEEVNCLIDETNRQKKILSDAKESRDSLFRSKIDMEQQMTALQEDGVKLKTILSSLENEKQSICGEIELLRSEVADHDDLIRSERRNLEELRFESERSHAYHILEKINELYALLPADRADEAMNSLRK